MTKNKKLLAAILSYLNTAYIKSRTATITKYEDGSKYSSISLSQSDEVNLAEIISHLIHTKKFSNFDVSPALYYLEKEYRYIEKINGGELGAKFRISYLGLQFIAEGGFRKLHKEKATEIALKIIPIGISFLSLAIAAYAQYSANEDSKQYSKKIKEITEKLQAQSNQLSYRLYLIEQKNSK